ncbi:uncharacterized protein LOC123520098 isoform X2 [Portunus trituberculatus]|uniref:uncharacterized protein LOC123520098 isoform X2 n=1 Tax=Portunus trituberculatus TaxID=210409 RepID=UPI001E1CB3B2|nr:uncharacterized protein LOC123520098 isoform X2 [Portunus trituberculatus]
MACKRAYIEHLAVCEETGLSWDERSTKIVLSEDTSYSTALMKLSTKIDSYLLLLERHVALEGFTIDLVEVKEEEEEEEEGVLGFIQGRLMGKKKKDWKSRAEQVLVAAWQACEGKGYGGVHVLDKVTYEVMPFICDKNRYSVGQYGEALLYGLRAYFMFNRCHTLFQPDAVGLWGGGGGDCVEPVTECYLVLAWRIGQQHEVTGMTRTLLPTTTTTTATAAAAKKQGRKRGTGAQNIDEEPHTPARKKAKVTAQAPPATTFQAAPVKAERQEDIVNRPGPSNPRYSPQKKSNHSSPPPPPPPQPQPQPVRKKVVPQKSTNERAVPQQPTNEETDEVGDLANVTFGFEKATPRGQGKRASQATSRKSVLAKLWSEEEQEDLMHFFDTLNPSQSEQTCVALTCKYATMRFGRELSSKQLYQMVQQKDRPTFEPQDSYTLPGGTEAARATAVKLFHSLNAEVSESKRVAFTCRFMETQYGVKIQSKELFSILSGKKRRGRGGRV